MTDVAQFAACEAGVDDTEVLRWLAVHNDGELVFPPRICYISGMITFPHPVHVRGVNRGAAILTVDQVNHMLVFAAPDSVHISDITIGSLVPRAPGTVGIGITGVDMVGMNGGSTIERVTVFDHPNLVYALNCVGFQVRDCYLVNSTEAGLVIYNPEAPDTGDNDISGTVFDTTHAQSAAIKWHMGGGLRITHNKILAHRYGFLMEMTDEGDTSDLIFANNSVEAQAESCMLYRRLGQRIFTNVQIQNNQMVCEGPHLIKVETPGPWLSDIMITGNILHCLPGSHQVVFSGGHSALMKDNLLKGNGVNPVVVEAGASDIVVGYNKPPA